MSPGTEDSSIFLQLRWQAVLFSSYQFSTNRQKLAGFERQKPLGSPHQHFRGERGLPTPEPGGGGKAGLEADARAVPLGLCEVVT